MENFLRNRLITKSCKEHKTPYDFFQSGKADSNLIKFFVDRASAYKPKRKRKGKFDELAEEVIMMGFARGQAYRPYFLIMYLWSDLRILELWSLERT